MAITQINADVREWIKSYEGKRFHALLSDPPYHLLPIVKRFGKPNSAPAKNGVYKRTSRGFMGQTWDGGEIAFDPELWHALGELLYPGAFMFIYAGTRTYHRVATAVEEAGFVIHPAIGWITSQGFPKATRIDTQIDRKLGAKREKVGIAKTGVASGTHKHTGIDNKWGYNDDYFETAPASAEAATWQGHRYGLMALKPSFEFILCAQRPYSRNPLEDITRNGAGALNIDGARIGEQEIITWGDRKGNGNSLEWSNYISPDGREKQTPHNGRWPANVVLSHLPECVKVGTREESYPINRFTDGAKPFGHGAGHGFETEIQTATIDIYECVPECPVRRMNEQSHKWNPTRDIAQVFYSVPPNETEDVAMYVPKVTPKERHAGLTGKENIHPTLKPLELNRWLSTLLLPPDLYAPRRLLVPFAGVLSEAIGAQLAGWEEITAIELTPEYIPIGRARAEYWTNNNHAKLNHNAIAKEQLSFDEVLKSVANE